MAFFVAVFSRHCGTTLRVVTHDAERRATMRHASAHAGHPLLLLESDKSPGSI